MGSIKSSDSCQTTINSLWSCNTLEKAQDFLKLNASSSPITLSNFVSNSFVAPTSNQWIDSFEPKTGKLYAKIPSSGASDVEAAISVAKVAFKTWSRTARAERSRYLQRIATLIQENRELFAVWESIDQGKTLQRARIEVDRAVSNFSYV